MRPAHLVTRSLALALIALAAATSGCDSDPSPAVSGTVTLHAEEGIDLHSGKVQKPGNFKNSDLYVTSNGSSLELIPGGASPTQSRPVNWFVNGGGVNQTFDSLASVPDEAPATDAMGVPLVHAKTGNGFVALRRAGGYTKGWISAADGTAVTIEFEPLALED